MNCLRPLVSALLFALVQPALAADLDTQLTRFFTARLAGIGDDVTVTVRIPDARRPTCERPELSVPANARS